MPHESLLDRRQLLSGLALTGLGTVALPDVSFAKAARWRRQKTTFGH